MVVNSHGLVSLHELCFPLIVVIVMVWSVPIMGLHETCFPVMIVNRHMTVACMQRCLSAVRSPSLTQFVLGIPSIRTLKIYKNKNMILITYCALRRFLKLHVIHGTILQYFRPSLSYHLSLLSLFCLFLSDHLRQVLLYVV